MQRQAAHASPDSSRNKIKTGRCYAFSLDYHGYCEEYIAKPPNVVHSVALQVGNLFEL